MCVLKFHTIFVKDKNKMAAICLKEKCNFAHFTRLCIKIMDIKQNWSYVLYKKTYIIIMKNDIKMIKQNGHYLFEKLYMLKKIYQHL